MCNSITACNANEPQKKGGLKFLKGKYTTWGWRSKYIPPMRHSNFLSASFMHLLFTNNMIYSFLIRLKSNFSTKKKKNEIRENLVNQVNEKLWWRFYLEVTFFDLLNSNLQTSMDSRATLRFLFTKAGLRLA